MNHILTSATLSREVLIVPTPDSPDPTSLIRELGGVIKIGEVLGTWESRPDHETLLAAVTQKITQVVSAQGPILFGFSAYDAHPQGTDPKELHAAQKRLRAQGIAVKRGLGKGRKVRFVTSHEPTLSSVVVETNKLTGPGIELVFLLDGQKLHLGRTIAVQPFRELGARDYGRPAPDPRGGMLPPKLSQMLVNLAGLAQTKTILDPFCGSGTLLAEAWLMGYRSLIGSDIDSTAIARTKSNLEWLDPQATHTVRLIDSGIKQLPAILASGSVDAIVTEPYLGPPLRGNETREDIEEIERQLAPLFEDMLTSFAALLRPRGVAVVTFPLWALPSSRAKRSEAWRSPQTFVHASILERMKEHGFIFKQSLPTEFITPALASEFGMSGKTLVYGRPDQRVWREIAILEKIN
ncbi:RsmD family RNA methyltransferase [Candidatus Uhrbacteria bacterium]|nr:RsmD family RNA methyltransferase [Candidatus Uhrbacteria bacterium]